jgi:hypothetical protein
LTLTLIFLLVEPPNFILPSPLPEGGEVDERAVVNDDSQDLSRPESEVARSHKSATSSEKSESEPTESGHSPPFAVSPRSKSKRDEVEDSGTSKPTELAVEEMSPEEEGAFNPYDDVGSVSSYVSSPSLLVPVLSFFIYALAFLC